jgi:hypothetical protein
VFKKIKENNTMTTEELWDTLTAYDIATEKELQLVTKINGYSVDTLNDVLYVRTAYRSWEQMAECEGLNED